MAATLQRPGPGVRAAGCNRPATRPAAAALWPGRRRPALGGARGDAEQGRVVGQPGPHHGQQGRGRPGPERQGAPEGSPWGPPFGGGWLAEPVGPGWVDHLPGPPDRGVGGADAVGLAGQPRDPPGEGVTVGVVGPRRQALQLHLVDGVVDPVDRHVEPGAEHALVVGAAEAGGDLGRPAAALDMGRGEQHPGGLDLQLDPAVEVQVSEEAVVVVADGDEGRDDQAAHAAGLGGPVNRSLCFQAAPTSPCRRR
jgi:hypothetical protein